MEKGTVVKVLLVASCAISDKLSPFSVPLSTYNKEFD